MLQKAKSSRDKKPRYWGWGNTGVRFDPIRRDRLLKALRDEYRMEPLADCVFSPSRRQITLPRSRLPREFLVKWRTRGLSFSDADRIAHASGKSYRDLVRIRSGTLEHYPDGVLFLRSAADLVTLFQEASRYRFTIVPYGGGTGVVGGTECVGVGNRPVLVVDLKSLDEETAFDPVSGTATFEAGILGPALEARLGVRNHTLGHFPQSFEFSTLGGWVATRSAGQNSTKYGKIENMVQSLSIATPQGNIATHAVPASATGPSLKELLVGSEGIYGIITLVTVKVFPSPQKHRMLTVFFRNFSDGRAAVRGLLRESIRPAIVRVHDPEETRLFMGLAPTSGFKRALAPVWLAWKGMGSRPCFAMFSSEGGNELVRFEIERIRATVLAAGGIIVSEDDGSRWHGGRFELPYLRDDLLDHGYFIDTLETAAPWSRLDAIHSAVREAFTQQHRSELIVGAHLSHAYPDGASLYFTFIGRQDPGREITQWEKIKSLATETILGQGGTLSHHHGIGYDHRRWMEREQTPLGLNVLKSVKKTLDPEGLLNPGKTI